MRPASRWLIQSVLNDACVSLDSDVLVSKYDPLQVLCARKPGRFNHRLYYNPQAANQTFLVSDGQDLSTTELVRGMAQAAGVRARLLPVPVWALQAGASLLGKGDAVQRLCGNLQVDISKARRLLGWVPPVSVEEGLRRAMAV